MTKVEILGTGPEFVRKGIRGVEPVVEETISGATREIQIMSYVFTSSAVRILDLIEQVARRGINVCMIVNDLQSQDAIIKSKLRAIAKDLPHVRIFNFQNPEKRQLHAKIVVVDRKKAIVGSANFSWGGMFGNYEVGLLVEGDSAWKLGEIVDSLSAICTRYP
jgi:phosphatidylserine/phosphatidylglycerophosphate/cardiolipin synthase-like enzyme